MVSRRIDLRFNNGKLRRRTPRRKGFWTIWRPLSSKEQLFPTTLQSLREMLSLTYAKSLANPRHHCK
ncbi:hypothetical protein ACROYT_G044770 [Oculina patagonica]